MLLVTRLTKAETSTRKEEADAQ